MKHKYIEYRAWVMDGPFRDNCLYCGNNKRAALKIARAAKVEAEQSIKIERVTGCFDDILGCCFYRDEDGDWVPEDELEEYKGIVFAHGESIDFSDAT